MNQSEFETVRQADELKQAARVRLFEVLKTCKARGRTEGEIQTKIASHLKDNGYFVTKLKATTTGGIPDLLAIWMGVAIFLEVKRKNGRQGPRQAQCAKQLERAGAISVVVGPDGELWPHIEVKQAEGVVF